MAHENPTTEGLELAWIDWSAGGTGSHKDFGPDEDVPLKQGISFSVDILRVDY